jgi:F-type H+-transporting ATPase subunit alpha
MQIPTLEIKEIGQVEEVRQGIIKISGLPNCLYGQEIQFQNNLKGMIVEFSPAGAMGIVFGDEHSVKVGDSVSSQGKALLLPVAEAMASRVLSSLLEPLDGKGEIEAVSFNPAFRQASGVMEREPISEALLTGIKIIDLAIPIGRGQRELIVGDRQIGKTSIALDTIINQKGKNVACIYCWIGGNQTSLSKIIRLLRAKGAMDYTTVVCAVAGSSSAQQYLCPYAAATLGEYLMHKGRDVLVVFDDLTKHAWIYRQMSLLLERSPGREAYPGDIFFLHSQLMERAGRLKKEYGAGTMTFLPLAETLQGDITGYIPSNLVSITDGQIYLNTGLFQEGFKPAIDLELSVSRIGSKVQCPAVRDLSRGLRYEYVHYRSLLRLTRLRTKLSAEATQQLQRGRTLYELLIQENNTPIPLAEEIVLFYAFSRKVLEVISLEQVRRFKNDFFPFLMDRYYTLVDDINKFGDLNEAIKAHLDRAIQDYFRNITANKPEDDTSGKAETEFKV